MYSGVGEIFKRYWAAYGGLRALLLSPYFHLSLVLLGITSSYWLNKSWWDQPLAIVPNLLGFSLGGLAMFLSFGDDKFRAMLAEGTNVAKSPYIQVCATFAHFIVLQISALLIALVAKALDFPYDWPLSWQAYIGIFTKVFYAIGFLLFLYAVTSMLAATMAVFRVCSWYELHKKNEVADES